jgi:hypothetical protein
MELFGFIKEFIWIFWEKTLVVPRKVFYLGAVYAWIILVIGGLDYSPTSKFTVIQEKIHLGSSFFHVFSQLFYRLSIPDCVFF